MLKKSMFSLLAILVTYFMTIGQAALAANCENPDALTFAMVPTEETVAELELYKPVTDRMEKLTGKKIGKDFDEGKFTLPLIIALPLMTSKKQSLVLETLFERNETDFNEIIKMIKETGAIEKVEKICNKFSETCFKELNNFPESDYKTGLIDIVENINTRVS